MAFADDLRDLDATAFDCLADDAAAIFSRGGVVLATLPVMLDRVTQPATHAGVALLETVAVVRFPVSALAAQAPDIEPMAGDVLTISGVARPLRGTPWKDAEMGERDWLCPLA